MQFRDDWFQLFQGLQENIRAFDQLRLQTVAPAGAVFLEGTDHEGFCGDTEFGPQAAAEGFVAVAEMRQVDRDRDDKNFFRCDAGFQQVIAHRLV